MKHTRRPLFLTLAAAALVLGATAALAEEPQVPVTAEEHTAMAKEYAQKAAAWRAEASTHRAMAATYAKRYPDSKGGLRNPWAVKMEKHCLAIVKDAEKLASDAELAAKLHEVAAKEAGAK